MEAARPPVENPKPAATQYPGSKALFRMPDINNQAEMQHISSIVTPNRLPKITEAAQTADNGLFTILRPNEDGSGEAFVGVAHFDFTSKAIAEVERRKKSLNVNLTLPGSATEVYFAKDPKADQATMVDGLKVASQEIIRRQLQFNLNQLESTMNADIEKEVSDQKAAGKIKTPQDEIKLRADRERAMLDQARKQSHIIVTFIDPKDKEAIDIASKAGYVKQGTFDYTEGETGKETTSKKVMLALNRNRKQLEEETKESGERELTRIAWQSDEGVKWRWGNYIDVVEQFDNKAMAKIQQIIEWPFEPGKAERNIAEMVVSRSALKQLTDEQRAYLKPYLETIIPLDRSGNKELEDTVLLVFGKNADNRQGDLAKRTAEMQKARAVAANPQLVEGEVPAIPGISIINLGGEVPPELKNDIDDLRKQYKAMVKKLDYNEDDIEFDDGESIFTAAVKEENGKKIVVGTGLVQDDSFTVNRVVNGVRKEIPVNRLEIGAGYVDPEMRGKDLYKLIQQYELRQVAQRKPPVDLIAGYDAINEPILKSVAAMGRQIVAPTLEQEINMTINGMPMHNLNSEHKMDDYLMTYQLGEDIRSRYGAAA